MTTVPRRAVLVGGLAALAGCGVGGPSAPVGGSGGPRRRPSPHIPPQTVPTLAAYAPWLPGPGEVEPRAKVVAARAVEALGRDEGRLTRVVYPQYGGLLPDAGCVMVVARQEWISDGARRGQDLTVDVRLERRGGPWRVDDLRVHSRHTNASRDGARLLRTPGLEIPGAAEADIEAGRVSPQLSLLLRGLSREHRLAVSVFVSGHPWEVFGTDGPSNHSFGRAVDIWAVDGRPVAGMALDDPVLVAVLRRARELGSDEVGGPVDPDGPGGVHFANDLHRDHVHIGFDA